VIDREDWIDFIRWFFGIGATDEWMIHVIRNWNTRTRTTDCGCSWSFNEDPKYKFCEYFLDIKSTQIVDD
jgi:hypothetical protein